MYVVGILIVVTHQGLSASSNTDYDEYEYSDDNVENIQQNDGNRLVGARESSTTKFPFLVGWNQYGIDKMFACTGSLLTPKYVLSAAHCNNMLEQGNGRQDAREQCVKTTASGQWYRISGGMDRRIKCRWLECKRCRVPSLEVITNPPAKAWIGIDKVKENHQKNQANMHEIKRHIRHGESYRGGGSYGNYGGYDITLLEMVRPMMSRPACLPSPDFDDIRLMEKNTILAGYGKYLRTKGQTCQTNKYGRMKKHYCDKNYGDGNTACITNKPAPMHKECQEFFKNPSTPNNFQGKEIRITDKSGKDITICYPPKNPENRDYGWCMTRGNYYNIDREDTSTKSWGFCGKDCFLDTQAEDKGVLRDKENIEILPEDMCDKYLNISLNWQDVPVRPQILCVAENNMWEEEHWQKTRGGYTRMKQHGPVTRFGSTSYVASVGTCQGDSGGPAFVRDGFNFVVTGVVSGGRGTLGECGGINNPVHYVRVKKLIMWIMENLGPDKHKVCWDQKFEARRRQMANRRKRFNAIKG